MKVLRCPACGAPVEQTDRCPYCKCYFDKGSVSSPVQDTPPASMNQTVSGKEPVQSGLGGLAFTKGSEPNENAFSLAVPVFRPLTARAARDSRAPSLLRALRFTEQDAEFNIAARSIRKPPYSSRYLPSPKL